MAQDTQNLKKKIKIYEQYILDAKLSQNSIKLDYWSSQLKMVMTKLDSRDKNRKKNLKLFKKAN